MRLPWYFWAIVFLVFGVCFAFGDTSSVSVSLSGTFTNQTSARGVGNIPVTVTVVNNTGSARSSVAVILSAPSDSIWSTGSASWTGLSLASGETQNLSSKNFSCVATLNGWTTGNGPIYPTRTISVTSNVSGSSSSSISASFSGKIVNGGSNSYGFSPAPSPVNVTLYLGAAPTPTPTPTPTPPPKTINIHGVVQDKNYNNSGSITALIDGEFVTLGNYGEAVPTTYALTGPASLYAGKKIQVFAGQTKIGEISVPLELTSNVEAEFSYVFEHLPDPVASPTPLSPDYNPVPMPTITPGPGAGAGATPTPSYLPSGLPTPGVYGPSAPPPSGWYEALEGGLTKGDMYEAVKKGIEDADGGVSVGSGLTMDVGSTELISTATSTREKFYSVLDKLTSLKNKVVVTLTQFGNPNLQQVGLDPDVDFGLFKLHFVCPPWLYDVWKLALVVAAFFAAKSIVASAVRD